MRERYYFIYILTNKMHTVLYTGVTNDLKRRVWEHKEKLVEGFTKKYAVDKLIYYEVTEDVTSAIAREKQIKSWKRNRKEELIASLNPGWSELYDRL